MMLSKLIIVGVQLAFVLQGINCVPVKTASPELTRLTVVVSAVDDIPSAVPAKPARIPHINATPGKTTKFSVPLEITVNSHLIRRINTQNSKYRVCSKKSKVHEWRPSTQRSPPCITYLNLFVQIELEVPINVESIVEEYGRSRDVDVVPYKYADQAFDGSEKVYASTLDDYYHAQTAVGDPIRSKRTKRARPAQPNDFFGDTESIVRKVVRQMWRTQ
ncbi:uncharacterized protein LOC129569170 [Sitodiplosis mosellana]|uniref:uncharacterized protein LOC129569170 n=1 Tax=Sitodiplosis mosellana TaxID=263140 RepID=UPI002445222A|nr:uncharacterized protein LOC129569170 [Sitodiplosis mosellana]